MGLDSKEARAARERARETYSADLTAYPEFQAINVLVQKPTTSSVTDAIQRILDLTRAAASAEPGLIGDHLYHTSLSVIEIAKRTAPEDQVRLVEFVVRLQKNALVNSTGKPLTHDGYRVWTDVPCLGYIAADEWNAVDVLDPQATTLATSQYENLIAFLAQLSAAAPADDDDGRIPETDFSFWSIRAFKDAFSPNTGGEAAMRVASRWMQYAATKILANVKHERVFGKRGDDPGTVMTTEMWDTWRDGFLTAQDIDWDEATGQGVSHALGCMDEAASA
ncbi:hypothetical protein GGS20DRAFT_233256 [Poronia punctata]|nr:hypothetical protein GGS20DRAFT_233256 [Poronia punctata]